MIILRPVLAAWLLYQARQSLAAPVNEPHEKRLYVPSGWTKHERLDSSATVPVRIGIAHRDTSLTEGHDHLMDISSPNSPNFGKRWTTAEVHKFFQPHDDSISAVKQWLEESNVQNATLSRDRAWYSFSTTAQALEKLLNAEYFEYRHDEGQVSLACDQYHLPSQLKAHIDYVTPGVLLLPPTKQIAPRKTSKRDTEIQRRAEADPDDLSHCDKMVTPACVAALYQIPVPTLSPNPDNKLGIYQSLGESWNQENLDSWFTQFVPRIPNSTHPEAISIDGAPTAPRPDHTKSETFYDLDASYPIIYPQEVILWSENDLHYQLSNSHFTYAFNQFLDAVDGSYCTYSAYGETGDLPAVDPSYPDPTPDTGYNGTLQCGVYPVTNVVSFSYGGVEANLPIAWQKRQCNEFLKLSLQGVSLLFSSGDTGVGAYGTFSGSNETQPSCLGEEDNIFNPQWPTNCPYVTAVGGTMIPPGKSLNDTQPEVVASHFGFQAGGGFSNIYPMPDYQKEAVEAYLDKVSLPFSSYAGLAKDVPNPQKLNITEVRGDSSGVFNSIGRAYPDVSAIAYGYPVGVDGFVGLAAGTSLSAPMVAAMINRINEERLAVGKGPVGFLNPVLYANPDIFNDIVSGSIKGCNTTGFAAIEGWDAATGLGTINYPKLLKVFMDLP